MLEGKRTPFLEGSLDRPIGELAILWVQALEVGGVVDFLPRRGEPEDAVELAGPGDRVVSDVPGPVADVREGLRLPEQGGRPRKLGVAGLALSQRRSHDEKTDRDQREERLRNLDALGRRVRRDGDLARYGSPGSECADDEARRRRACSVEAQRSPEEQRKEKVGVAP